MIKMYGAEEAFKIIIGMKNTDADSPTNSASSNMETDLCENQSYQSGIVSAEKTFLKQLLDPDEEDLWTF